MALEYRFGGKAYDSAYALRLEHPEFVFPDDADAELLAPIGIELVETPDPEPDPEEIRRLKLAEIDMETQQAIFGGFDYEIGGELLHFSYDSFDQQNFADTANACLMLKSGAQGLPETVTRNGYRADGTLVRLTFNADDFLALYARGALAHKAACIDAGSAKKAELEKTGVSHA